MSRIRVGWKLTGRAWSLLRAHPTLFRFPAYGAVTALPMGLLAAAGVYLIDTERYAPGIAALLVGAFLSSFLISFFSVALVACADEVLHERPAESSKGFAVARSRLGTIAGWALIAAFVGLLLELLESLGKVGEIVRLLTGAAWSLLTFLVIPVLAIEDVGPVEAIKRSGKILRSRWVEQLTGIPTIGLVVFLLILLPAAILVGAGVVLWISDDNGASVAAGGVMVAVGIVVLVAGGLIQSALRSVFGIVLYRFAADDEALGGFTAEDLESAVRTKAPKATAAAAI